MVGVPPDMGNDYARELERRQLDDAYQRQGRTGVPSEMWAAGRVGIAPRRFSITHLSAGQKRLVLGLGIIIVIVLAVVGATLTPPPAPR